MLHEKTSMVVKEVILDRTHMLRLGRRLLKHLISIVGVIGHTWNALSHDTWLLGHEGARSILLLSLASYCRIALTEIYSIVNLLSQLIQRLLLFEAFDFGL